MCIQFYYGKCFLGKSHYCDSNFKIQKRIIGFVMDSIIRDPCCTLLKQWNSINSVHSTDWRHPTTKFATFQKAGYYFGIKAFNILPLGLKALSNGLKFM